MAIFWALQCALHLWTTFSHFGAHSSPRHWLEAHIQQQHGKSQNMHMLWIDMYFVFKNTNLLVWFLGNRCPIFCTPSLYLLGIKQKSLLKKRTRAWRTLPSQIYQSHDTHLQPILESSASQWTWSLVCALYANRFQVFFFFDIYTFSLPLNNHPSVKNLE